MSLFLSLCFSSHLNEVSSWMQLQVCPPTASSLSLHNKAEGSGRGKERGVLLLRNSKQRGTTLYFLSDAETKHVRAKSKSKMGSECFGKQIKLFNVYSSGHTIDCYRPLNFCPLQERWTSFFLLPVICSLHEEAQMASPYFQNWGQDIKLTVILREEKATLLP